MMSVREVVTRLQAWVSDDLGKCKTLYFPSWNYYKVYIKAVEVSGFLINLGQYPKPKPVKKGKHV